MLADYPQSVETLLLELTQFSYFVQTAQFITYSSWYQGEIL